MAFRDKVKENSTAYVTITFRDKDNVASQPASATYDLVDVVSGDILRDDVTLNPVDGVVEITLTKNDNKIINTEHSEEPRRLTIHGVYGADDEVHAEYLYDVVNLSEVQ